MPLELALSGERCCGRRRGLLQLLPAVEVDHVVEVTGALSFGKRSHLLGEHLFKRVAQDVDAVSRAVAVGVVNGAEHGRQHQHFVRR